MKEVSATEKQILGQDTALELECLNKMSYNLNLIVEAPDRVQRESDCASIEPVCTTQDPQNLSTEEGDEVVGLKGTLRGE